MPPIVRKDCSCPNVTCQRHTLCDECEAEQVRKGGLPFCRKPTQPLWETIKKMLGIR